MSNDVKRYSVVLHVANDSPFRQTGDSCTRPIRTDVVLATDYAALEAECSRLRAALGQYADDNNWRYDTCNISRDVAKDALAAGGGCI